ncbi:MAG: putative DNA binding domain-containing protein [Deltaproteobacteria bacterium]|nr:putative DNA binding domain-containing protein [Deltaproteobacteria bacterium]
MKQPGKPPFKKKTDLDRIKLFIREGEGLTLEFKEKFTPRIDEDLVAFANTKGGTLLLGVRDNGSISGERLSNDLKARINSLARNCQPPIAIEMTQTDNVVAIEVPEGSEKPYSCRAGYFRRLNGTTQKMSHQEIRIMFRENETVPFEERTVRGFSFEDISKAKIRSFIKEADIHLGNISAADFLRSLKVADESGVKNAGILFFAKDVYDHLHQAQMTLLAFKGTDRLHIYDRSDVRDDLLTQLNEAVAFLKKHLNIRSEIRGFDREDIYEIPLDVLREALVNALMHRDYSITGTQVSVEVYDDRVEIVNPGSLPEGLSIQDLGKVSVRRNEIIADLFFRLHKVERIGMGIQKMKDAMAAAGLREPTFVPNAFFRAIFYRSPEFALKEKERGRPPELVEGLVEGLAENQKKILILIARNPRVSKKAMAQSLGISTTAIDKNLTTLKQKGFIRRVGPDKGGYWEVVP